MHETRIPKGFYEMDFVFSPRFSNEYYINKRDYTLISRKQYQTLSQQQRDWESARRCAKIAYAHRFNIEHVWYPEIWSDPGSIVSVVVRPYDSYVAHSALMSNGFRDGNRALAATMFARALGVPIEVLE